MPYPYEYPFVYDLEARYVPFKGGSITMSGYPNGQIADLAMRWEHPIARRRRLRRGR